MFGARSTPVTGRPGIAVPPGSALRIPLSHSLVPIQGKQIFHSKLEGNRTLSVLFLAKEHALQNLPLDQKFDPLRRKIWRETQ